jgi:aminoglycoside/choline kinase family phosphotransferase
MHELKAWLAATGWGEWKVEKASEDASFRRYFRLTQGSDSYILMDASLEKEALVPFLDITRRLLDVNVHAPKIIEQSPENGYLIIEDFGSAHYLDLLDETNFTALYGKAIDEIVLMQHADTDGLPLYDKAFLRFEMDLMQVWFLEKYVAYPLTPDENKLVDATLETIADEVLSQPQGVFVHRDYHSRNMLLTPEHSLGVIDYQDAMNGAITYDLVSLLKDCYIRFDRQAVEALALQFRDKKGLAVDDATFLRWFDFMGMQRHIKVLGIFARLYLRDGKPGYLKDLPLMLQYATEALFRYPETQALGKLLEKVSLPRVS